MRRERSAAAAAAAVSICAHAVATPAELGAYF